MDKAKLFFLLFFVSVGIQKTDFLLSLYTGVELSNFLGGTLLYFPIIFLFLATFFYRQKNKNITSIRINRKISILIIALIVLSFYGFIRENKLIFIVYELWIYIVVILSMKIAVYDKAWEDIKKPLVIIFWIFFILVLMGTTIPRRDYSNLDLGGYNLIEEGKTTASVAYDIYPILDFWPVIFAMYFLNWRERGLYKFFGILTLVAYLGIHIYFAKRAPSMRAVVYLISAFLLVRHFYSIKKFMPYFIIFLIGVAILNQYVSTDMLMAKYEQKDVSRIEEAMIMLNQLDPLEFIFGRGLGGYFEISDHEGTGIIEVGPNHEMGKTILHIGFFYPILKGGILFLLIHLMFFLPYLKIRKKRHLLKNIYTGTAFVVLPVYLIFRLIEGPFSTGMVFDGFIFGFCAGRLNSIRI